MASRGRFSEPVCPFYSKHNGNKLYCEGAIIKFPNKESKPEWINNNCSHEENYKVCPIYKMLLTHYDNLYDGGKTLTGGFLNGNKSTP